MRVVGCVLLLAGLAFAGGKQAEARKQVDAAMRRFYGTRGGGGDATMKQVRDQLIAALPHIGGKEQGDVRNALDKVFGYKVKYSQAYLRYVADVIASNGKRGISKLHNRYGKLKRSHKRRLVIVEALGECDNVHALTVLRKMIHDKDPDVAVAAIDGCAKYAGETKKAKNATMRDLINLYGKVTAKAQGKGKQDKQRIRYEQLKPAFDQALNAFSDGEKLDSAQAWDAWLREQMSRKR